MIIITRILYENYEGTFEDRIFSWHRREEMIIITKILYENYEGTFEDRIFSWHRREVRINN